MFLISSRLVDGVEPFEYYTGAAGLVRGQAAVLTAGALASCGATTRPTHIVQGPKNAEGRYPVIPVRSTTIFEAPCATALAQSVVGNTVTLAANALGITGTTTGGVFTVTGTTATAGSAVRGYFA